MDDVRAVQAVAEPGFAAYVQLASTVGARRGTIVALRWGAVDLDAGTATFTTAIAESEDGLIEKGTKADRPYVVSLGPSTVKVLAEHRQRSIEQALAVGASFGAGSFVFSDDGGTSHWALSWPTHAWSKYGKMPHGTTPRWALERTSRQTPGGATGRRTRDPRIPADRGCASLHSPIG